MNKVALSDGRWFDKDQAKAFAADYFYHPNGNPDRPICLATGSEFSSETLFLTLEGTSSCIMRTIVASVRMPRSTWNPQPAGLSPMGIRTNCPS